MVDASARFAALRRAPWRRRKRPLAIAAGVLLAVAALTLAALAWLPQLAVNTVEVHGTTYVDEVKIEDAARRVEGQPLAFADTDALTAAMVEIAGVKSVEITRAWPDTLEVSVTERVPVGRIERGGGSVVVDSEGYQLPNAAAKDLAIPELQVAGDARDVDAVEDALVQVVTALPQDVRSSLRVARASTPSNVTLEIMTDDGARQVVWGSAADSDLKSRVLVALLGQPGDVIDVSAPNAPTVR